jgi:hypothetical protein
MRPGPNAKRSRGRGNGHGHGGGRKQNVPLRLQTLDSSGPNGKLRGNAYQLHEKYLALARDAHSSGDRIAAENFYQHAEHYYRIINANGGATSRHDFDAFEGGEGEQPDIRQGHGPGPGNAPGSASATEQPGPANGPSDGTEPQPY